MYDTVNMSIELAAVESVLLAPLNFIVDVSVREPVASCVIMKVIVCPLTGLVNADKVKLPVAVIVWILPLAAFGVNVVAPLLPIANTVSRISSNTAVSAVIVVNVPAALVVEPIGVASMALALIRPPAKIAQPFVIVVFVPAVGAAATYNVPASVTVIALVLAMVGAAIA